MKKIIILTGVLFFYYGFNARGENAAETRAYSEKGADTCIKCHDEDNTYPIFPIFKSKHGQRQDPRSPMAQLQCETCHGPLGLHNKSPQTGEKRPAMIGFGTKFRHNIEQQNKQCLQCHQHESRIHWEGSTHASAALSCSFCHTIHAEQDPVLDQRQQTSVCWRCHNKQRAEFNKTSAHPLRQGKMACHQCHQAHGSFNEKSLKQNKNELCLSCHGEKRGPFLWSHPPAMEDCGLCHEAHGSIHADLLKKRAPLLCQQCHAIAGHPSIAYTGNNLSGANPNAFLLGKSCLNCHSQIHGSNHPSGVKLIR